ncbi:MAG TPA: hypothetical protein VFJ57_01190 [Solirubrobacterales bacterium]|nr:hypothetical protein [Solirubrobacterales bacterium]
MSTGMSLQSAGIALIAGNGNDGALQVVRFLKDHGRNLSFLVVDSDSSDGKLFRKDKLKAAGIEKDKIHFIGGRELEDLFTDSQWAATANIHWPKDDQQPWTTNDFATLRGQEKFSKAVENVVRGQSSHAPQGKPGYLTALVQGLQSVDEVPADLVKVFRQLAGLSHDG